MTTVGATGWTHHILGFVTNVEGGVALGMVLAVALLPATWTNIVATEFANPQDIWCAPTVGATGWRRVIIGLITSVALLMRPAAV